MIQKVSKDPMCLNEGNLPLLCDDTLAVILLINYLVHQSSVAYSLGFSFISFIAAPCGMQWIPIQGLNLCLLEMEAQSRNHWSLWVPTIWVFYVVSTHWNGFINHHPIMILFGINKLAFWFTTTSVDWIMCTFSARWVTTHVDKYCF